MMRLRLARQCRYCCRMIVSVRLWAGRDWDALRRLAGRNVPIGLSTLITQLPQSAGVHKPNYHSTVVNCIFGRIRIQAYKEKTVFCLSEWPMTLRFLLVSSTIPGARAAFTE